LRQRFSRNCSWNCRLTPTGHQALWQAVLTTIQCDVTPSKFATWLEPTVLLDIDHQQQRVVGTPNVFARDAVKHHRLALLTATRSGQFQQAYTLEVVINGF
jgi:chromosomal replication initiation ATPase DnaA